jgi:hypothetical protein
MVLYNLYSLTWGIRLETALETRLRLELLVSF